MATAQRSAAAAAGRSGKDLIHQMMDLQRFIGPAQMNAITSAMVGEEGDYFRQMVRDLAELVENMPRVYQQDGKGDAAIVHLHYFKGGCDWWITERDTSAVQHQAFGLASLGYDAELGYISIVELIRAGVELDLHWTPKTLGEVKAGQR